MEQWKEIEGYEGIYEVSDQGRVRNVKKENYILAGVRVAHGYIAVSLNKNNKKKMYLVHRLVATAFIENPENKEQVNHIDGVKAHNSVDNLEWVTPQENLEHAQKIGLTPWGVSNPPEYPLRELREKRGYTVAELAKKTGLRRQFLEAYENGERDLRGLSITRAYKVAHALGVSIETLAGYDERG